LDGKGFRVGGSGIWGEFRGIWGGFVSGSRWGYIGERDMCMVGLRMDRRREDVGFLRGGAGYREPGGWA